VSVGLNNANNGFSTSVLEYKEAIRSSLLFLQLPCSDPYERSILRPLRLQSKACRMATQAKSRIKSAHGNTLYDGTKQGVKVDRPVPQGEDRFLLYHYDTARRPELGCVRGFINIPTSIPDT
jgi:hypothetical protein